MLPYLWRGDNLKYFGENILLCVNSDFVMYIY